MASQDAAQVQAQLKQLETELGAAALDSGLLSTSSDTVTRGVRVKVQRCALLGLRASRTALLGVGLQEGRRVPWS